MKIKSWTKNEWKLLAIVSTVGVVILTAVAIYAVEVLK